SFRKLIEGDLKDKMDSIKGRVIAWDVINEFVHEKDFFPYLPKDIAVQWFKMAKELDPNAQLFINEYGMLNSIASPKNILDYIGIIAELRNAGAPIEAIGVQGHVGRQPRNPAQVLTDLDMFKATGLPVQITEFDINMTDEELQADYTRDFLIACYSHPGVTGFTIWGFWQAAHWKPDAAMFRNDWSAKPNAAVWREWVTKKWKTTFTETTHANGRITSRGHLGRYEITVTKNGTERKVIYHLTKKGKPLQIKL
ncbi:MAG: endo-1,4-beta-xylanase, partial [Chitinophagaceae bacterium]